MTLFGKMNDKVCLDVVTLTVFLSAVLVVQTSRRVPKTIVSLFGGSLVRCGNIRVKPLQMLLVLMGLKFKIINMEVCHISG